MKQSLKERLVAFLLKYHGWIANGELQRIVARETSYTPRTTARRLEELVNDKRIVVEYRKGHAWYKIIESPEEMSVDELTKKSLAWFDSLEQKPMYRYEQTATGMREIKVS